MYRILSIITLCALLAACGRKESLEDIEARAGQTAVEYYKLLQEGKYSDFIAGMEYGDSLPKDYRSQLVDNVAMFVKQQKDNHKGIVAITLSRCHADTAHNTAEAYINIHYADSAQEVVCVPLVMQGEIWRMK